MVSDTMAVDLRPKRNTLRLLLDSGDNKDFKFSEFPATFSWGRKDAVPVKYILGGRTYRGKKKKQGWKYRKEGIPTDPYEELPTSEVEALMADVEASVKSAEKITSITARVKLLYNAVRAQVMEEAGKIISAFDADHSKSETLRAQKEEEFSWLIVAVGLFAGAIGNIIGHGVH